MDIEAIHAAMVEIKAQSAEKPEYLLLTDDEWLEVRNDPMILPILHFKATGMADELYGLPVVIEGSAKHIMLQEQGRIALRPNTRR